MDPAHVVHHFSSQYVGYRIKEWKGVSSKTKATITIGILTIIASVMIVGYGNSLK
jgi:L-rhamnose-H+ transport protein